MERRSLELEVFVNKRAKGVILINAAEGNGVEVSLLARTFELEEDAQGTSKKSNCSNFSSVHILTFGPFHDT